MKGGGLFKFRVKKLSLSLIALLCFSFAMWAWDQIPLLTTLLPPSDEADNLFISSPVISKRSPSKTQKPKYSHQQSFTMDAQSDSSTKTNISANANSEQSHYQRISYEQTVDEDNLEMVTSKTQKSKNSHQQSFTMDAQSDSSTKTNISANAYSEQSHYQRSSYEHTVDEDNLKMVTSEKKECNYGKGKWVADNRRPLYSGFGCKQWLAEGWSCRLSTRKDFSFENYRWQPNDCEMPDFVGSNFLRRMQHKTVAIVGDSLGRQQFQSLLCMVTGGRDYPEVEDIGRQFGFLMAPGDLRPNGWAYRFPKTNTTILYHWSASLCEIEPINQTDPNTNYAMHLDRPARFLQQFLDKLDVLVLNTGHHWNRGKLNANKWVMYVNGTPNTNRKVAQIWNAKELTIRSVVKWLDSQIERIPKSKVFFRTISPRHFVNGDWNTGGSCDSTVALAGGSEVTQDRSSDPVIEDAVKGTRVKLLDITALSQLRDEGHISKFKSPQGGYDCLHWCLPGIPDTWNEILAAQV